MRTTSDKATTAPQPVAQFATTHWSVVVTAQNINSPQAFAALETLCRAYWQPLYAYVRRRGYSLEDAQDLTQEFFARLLQGQLVAKADRERGRFRSFLLVSLKHFLAHEWDKARAQKRGGQVFFVPLDLDTTAAQGAPVVATRETPDQVYDRQWALSLLDTVLQRLRKDYTDCGRDDLFLALKDTLAGGRSEIAYRELGGRLGMSEGAVKVAVHRLRQRYRVLLREEIARTVSEPTEVEEELRHLFAALAT